MFSKFGRGTLSGAAPFSYLYPALLLFIAITLTSCDRPDPNAIGPEDVNLREMTDDMFASEIVEKKEPYLVDFWAPWCGPCKMIGPVIKELARENNGKINVAKINVDENQKVAADFQITGIPTIMLFKDGVMQEKVVGILPKEELQALIDKHF